MLSRCIVSEEYEESCRDKIHWNEIEQLHESTIQISGRCFEYKKLCVGIIGVLCAALIKFNKGELDLQLLVYVAVFTALGFWICDATAYYYQKRNRSIMNDKFLLIARRNNCHHGLSALDNASWFESFFNISMLLYFYIFIICLALKFFII